jgi:DNA polymerase-3 subunit gamma/tau
LSQAQQKTEMGSQKPAAAIQQPVNKKPEPVKQQPYDEAKLIIEDPATAYISSDEEEQNYLLSQQQVTQPQGNQPQTTNNKQQASKLGTLESIRQKFANKQAGAANPAIPLTLEKLQQDWVDFSQRLKDNKNPAAQSFDMARLVITSENSFEIVSNNNLEQKFIEGERRELSEYMQAKFNNRTLLFTIIVTDNPVGFVETERPLNTKEQYQKIVDQYPLVNELKNRLKLGLDY